MNDNVQLESLTLYNNNVTDAGAIELAETMKGNSVIRIVNLQMNFIRDKGGHAFMDCIKNEECKEIWKIILLDN